MYLHACFQLFLNFNLFTIYLKKSFSLKRYHFSFKKNDFSLKKNSEKCINEWVNPFTSALLTCKCIDNILINKAIT